jgi:hypothetical protein
MLDFQARRRVCPENLERLYRRLFVGGVDEFEETASDGSTHKVRQQMNPEVGNMHQLHEAETDGDRRIESGSGNAGAADSENQEKGSDECSQAFFYGCWERFFLKGALKGI